MLEKNQKDVWNSLYKNNFSWNLEPKIPNVCKGKIVLELGVGTGKTLHSILNQKPKEVYAIDFSEKSIKICKEKFKSKNIFFHNINIKKMPFKNNHFDIAVCYFILNNLNKSERIKAVSEIKRVLKSKGIVLFRDFLSGDYRELSFNKKGFSKSGRFCHFFKEKEIESLFFQFSTKKIKLETLKPIRKNPELKRHFIEGILIK